MVSPRRFRVELIAVSELSVRVRSLRFRAHGGFEWRAGQYLELISPDDGVTRFPYSIASPMDARRPGEFELAVVRGGTAEVLDGLELHSVLDAEGPRGSLSWRDVSSASALLIGAGTGVAPLRAMVREELERGGATRMVLLCGHRSEGDVLWSSELGALSREHARFRFEPTLSRAGDVWRGRRGRVQDHLAELIEPLRSDLAVYVCGQTAMVDDVIQRLGERHGLAAERIRGEGH